MIWDELAADDGSRVIVDPVDSHHRLTVDAAWTSRELVVPVFRGGERVYELPALADARDHARHELGTLHPAILRQLRPHWYPAGLEWGLHVRREALIEAELEHRGARGLTDAPATPGRSRGRRAPMPATKTTPATANTATATAAETCSGACPPALQAIEAATPAIPARTPATASARSVAENPIRR